ncbi:hypothetical protein QBC39DRAFT_364584, partial [Podospora conica]
MLSSSILLAEAIHNMMDLTALHCMEKAPWETSPTQNPNSLQTTKHTMRKGPIPRSITTRAVPRNDRKKRPSQALRGRMSLAWRPAAGHGANAVPRRSRTAQPGLDPPISPQGPRHWAGVSGHAGLRAASRNGMEDFFSFPGRRGTGDIPHVSTCRSRGNNVHSRAVGGFVPRPIDTFPTLRVCSSAIRDTTHRRRHLSAAAAPSVPIPERETSSFPHVALGCHRRRDAALERGTGRDGVILLLWLPGDAADGTYLVACHALWRRAWRLMLSGTPDGV